MSKATKRKHVTKEVLEEYVTPVGNQIIVKVMAGRGNNLHEVETPRGESYLVSMPTKFRRNVWIKRGDFIIVEPIEEGVKVQAEIVHILYPKQIRELIKDGIWPAKFSQDSSLPSQLHTSQLPTPQPSGAQLHTCSEYSSDEPSSEEDDNLFVNTNRPCLEDNGTDSDSEND